jgi:hypothetical protein
MRIEHLPYMEMRTAKTWCLRVVRYTLDLGKSSSCSKLASSKSRKPVVLICGDAVKKQ